MTETAPITQAMILAGGFGTRLGELTKETPKPLLEVAGRPFIEYVIDWLARHGIEDIILSTGYLTGQFDDFLTDRQWTGPYGNPVRVRNLAEAEPAGTGGALKLHEAELADRFLLLNGDSFLDCHLAQVLSASERLADGEALLTMREVPDAGRYGRIHLDGGTITRFEEKSAAGQGLINAGITALTRDCLDRIEKLPCSIEKEIYPALAAEGKLQGIAQEGYFIDIGLPETYDAAQTEMPAALSKPALFLDRDGVINRDHGYVHRYEDFDWMPGVIEGIKAARDAGHFVIVVTNQAGVARGFYDEAAIETLHRQVNAKLRRSGTWIDAFYYCPFHPDGVVPAYTGAHEDRKPNPGMLKRAMADFAIDKQGSLLIGDKDSDIEAARAVGIKGRLIGEDETIQPVLREAGLIG